MSPPPRGAPRAGSAATHHNVAHGSRSARNRRVNLSRSYPDRVRSRLGCCGVENHQYRARKPGAILPGWSAGDVGPALQSVRSTRPAPQCGCFVACRCHSSEFRSSADPAQATASLAAASVAMLLSEPMPYCPPSALRCSASWKTSSPRSASVEGTRAIDHLTISDDLQALLFEIKCVACTRHQRWSRSAASIQQRRRGRQLKRSRQSRTSFGCSARWMWIGRAPGASAQTPAPTAAVIVRPKEPPGPNARASPRQRFGSSAKTSFHDLGASCTQPSGSSAKRRCAPT